MLATVRAGPTCIKSTIIEPASNYTATTNLYNLKEIYENFSIITAASVMGGGGGEGREDVANHYTDKHCCTV